MRFERNQGQSAPSVRFLARGSGYTLFLTPAEAVLTLSAGQSGKAVRQSPSESASAETQVVRIKLVGANPKARMEGAEEQPGRSNYFVGANSSQWRTNVPNYGRVIYREIYPGVDLVFYGNQGQLEYDFVVSSGADPNAIRLEFDGASKLNLDNNGDLLIGLSGDAQVLRLHRPLLYQETGRGRREIAGGYVLMPHGSVTFRVEDYDSAHPLVIDPVLSYSTYLGGSGNDVGYAIAADAQGNTYVTGLTGSPNFPTTTGAFQTANRGQDAFVTKLNAAGTALVYSTYLGGSDIEQGRGIALDSSGNAYITGVTRSADFPTTSGAFQTAGQGFVAKLNATGTVLLYSARFQVGGPDSGGNAIAVDASGNAYVTGSAGSGFVTTPGALQTTGAAGNGFVMKVNAVGSVLVYSTYLGAAASSVTLRPTTSIAVDSSGNAYVAGSTGPGFPTMNPLQGTYGGGTDAFVAKLNAAGSALVYATYLGGTGGEEGMGIAVDAVGNAYVVGSTDSSNFPTANPIQAAFGGTFSSQAPGVSGDVFVAKLSTDGARLVYSTYLGGRSPDAGRGIAVDATGSVYVTGTWGDGFPFKNSIIVPRRTIGNITYGSQPITGSAFVVKLNPGGNDVIFSTAGGGCGFPYFRCGIAIDAAGNAYLTGSAGGPNTEGAALSFMTMPGAFQATFPGRDSFARTAYVTKIDPNNPAPTLTSISPNAATVGGSGFTISVTGTNFLPTSIVRWNGSDRPTTFTNSDTTRLQATIPLTDLATVGQAAITVFTPTPGGGTSNAVTFSINPYPVPVIASISPSSMRFGGSAFTLSVFGSSLFAGSVVRWNGADRPTTFVSGSSSPSLTAAISAADVANPGVAQVTVFTPAPGGGVSNAVNFTISANPVPTIQFTTPSAIFVGSSAFNLFITGQNFTSGAVVRWNGNDRATRFQTSTSLTATIPASDVAALGSAQVTVFNPEPGGGTSNTIAFNIVAVPANPLPVITSLSPASIPVGSGDFTLAVNGTGFVGNSVVRWNGQDRATTLSSFSQLRVSVTAADVAALGSADVTVFNPPSVNGGGGLSGVAKFTITVNPLPAITSLSPQISAMGDPELTLIITGSGFVSGSVVRWNGADRPTRIVNNQLQATIPATDLARPETASVTVYNPPPAGGVSNAALHFTYVKITTNDAVYDPNSKKIYASVPSRAGDTGNSIVSIDPLTGAIGAPIFVGSEPGKLALSDDGRFLYVALGGAGALRRFDLGSQTPGLQFPISQVRDFAVVPGSPNTLAAIAANGLAVYDDGVQRPTRISNSQINSLTFGASATLYGVDSNILSYAVEGSGITEVGSSAGKLNLGTYSIGSNLAFESGLIFTNTGVVYDPVEQKLAGRFIFPTDVACCPGGPFAVDAALDRAFYVLQGRLLIFSRSSFAALGTLNIPGLSGDPTRLLRWGADGLAVRTGTQIFILRIPMDSPTLNDGGMVNAASFAAGAPVAPGSIVSVFGSRMVGATAAAETVPLPTTLGGAQLTMTSFGSPYRVPLFFVSPGQMNVQVPWELSNGLFPTPLTINLNGIGSNIIRVPVAATAPGLFSATQTGQGQGAILDTLGRVVDSSAPTRAGAVVLLYGTGFGLVANQPASGAAALASPLATTRTSPTVTVGGLAATVSFAGLAPGFVGLYQVNVTVPDGVAAGDAVPVVLSIGGATSNTVTIAVR